jgi:hypothetical protein
VRSFAGKVPAETGHYYGQAHLLFNPLSLDSLDFYFAFDRLELDLSRFHQRHILDEVDYETDLLTAVSDSRYKSRILRDGAFVRDEGPSS